MLTGIKQWLPFKRGEKHSQAVSAEPLAQVHHEINRIFDRAFGNGGVASRLPTSLDQWFGDVSPQAFTPSIDLADEARHVKLTADLPGMDREDIQLDFRDNTIILRGEKRTEESTEDDGFYRIERGYGAFERVVPLPVEVDADQAEAQFQNGVLTVRLPEVKEADDGLKKIPVQGG